LTLEITGARRINRGLSSDDQVTITIEPVELISGRREARERVVAAGLSDDDIDRLIEEARTEGQPLPDEVCCLIPMFSLALRSRKDRRPARPRILRRL
jgi:hypothetical protein